MPPPPAPASGEAPSDAAAGAPGTLHPECLPKVAAPRKVTGCEPQALFSGGKGAAQLPQVAPGLPGMFPEMVQEMVLERVQGRSSPEREWERVSGWFRIGFRRGTSGTISASGTLSTLNATPERRQRRGGHGGDRAGAASPRTRPGHHPPPGNDRHQPLLEARQGASGNASGQASRAGRHAAADTGYEPRALFSGSDRAGAASPRARPGTSRA